MEINSELIKKLEEFRKVLHKNPELSGKEKDTPKRIKWFIEKHNPHKIIENIGGNGVAFVYQGKEQGQTIAIRADIDALPIQEINDFEYKSSFPNVGHKCGHDGHMVMVAGLAELLKTNPIKKGKVILLFQPAEETGQGAFQVVEDEKFKQLGVDYVFGLHNLPGFKKGSIILRKETFAAASTGMILKLMGKTSHAAEPENGNSPVIAMANIMKDLTYLPQYQNFNDLVVSTVVHSKLGEIAFGTTPGYGEVMATLRAYDKDDFEILKDKALAIARNQTNAYKLNLQTEFVEEFPATINNDEGHSLVKSFAENNEFAIIEKETPFKWSEDFGHYLERYKGAFFGLGSGENHPQLHNPDYDFPDEIIPVGLKMFNSIIDYFNR